MYTPEQEKDIKERVEKATQMLKDLQLTAAVQTYSVNLGTIDKNFNSIFGTYLQCFLQDTKYQKDSVPSPLNEELK